MCNSSEMKPIFAEPCSKSYKFLCEDGSDVLVKESMAETEYSFRLPARLLELFLVDENQLLEEMKQLKGMTLPYAELVRDSIRRHESLISSYSLAVALLDAHKGPFFKRSTLKAEPRLAFVPVNLHIQRLEAAAPAAGRSLVHDVITVGAFTAFSEKFRDGGLLQMVDRLTSAARDAPAADSASALYQAEAAVQTIEHARTKILESCAALLNSVKDDDSPETSALLEIINTESSSLVAALHRPVVAAAHQLLASYHSCGAAPPLSCLSAPAPPPPCPPAAPLPADWRAAATAVTAAAGSLSGPLPAGQRAPVVSELLAGCDAALAAGRLARAACRLREQRRTQQLRDTARHRRDICFSHAVTASCVALLARLWCGSAGPALIRQLAGVGPLLQFEGLLSYYGHEAGMVQDMVVAVRDLEQVQFTLQPVPEPPQGSGVPEVRLDGGRSRLHVYLPTPQTLLADIPAGSSVSFRATAVFFNVGINEQATFAEYMGGTGPQRAFNEDAYRRLADYVNTCSEQHVLSDSSGEGGADVGELVVQLGQHVGSGRPKNVQLLQVAAEICRAVSGFRFCSCKSAKDRTSMSVTLEQVNVLSSQLRLATDERTRALAAMRTNGTRRKNAEKNVGSPRFSFNTLQLLTIPEEYRAPPGTYGDVES